MTSLVIKNVECSIDDVSTKKKALEKQGYLVGFQFGYNVDIILTATKTKTLKDIPHSITKTQNNCYRMTCNDEDIDDALYIINKDETIEKARHDGKDIFIVPKEIVIQHMTSLACNYGLC